MVGGVEVGFGGGEGLCVFFLVMVCLVSYRWGGYDGGGVGDSGYKD